MQISDNIRVEKFASLWSRSLALLFDILIAHIFYFVLLSFPSLESAITGWEFPTNLFGDHYGANAHLLLGIWCSTVLLRFYGTLILGRSLGQYLMGIYAERVGAFAIVRGALRVLLELPLILDLISIPLLLFRYPSIGESVTGTRLVCLSSARLSFKLIGLPILALVSALSPLLHNLTLIDYYDVDSLSYTKRKHKGDLLYNSNRFQASFKHSSEDFFIIPDFDISKSRRKKKITPFFIWVDKKSKKSCHVKVVKPIDTLSILARAREGNPLFHFYYPDLEQAIYQSNYGKIKPRKDLREQIDILVRDALELNIYTVWTHILTNGPFLYGHIALKNELLKLVGGGVTPKINVVRHQGRPLLKYEQHYSHDVALQKQIVESYVPLGVDKTYMYRVLWDEKMTNSKLRQRFMNSFLGSTDWHFGLKNEFSFPTSIEVMHPFSIVDFLSKGDLQKNERFMLEEYVLSYGKKLGLVAVEEKNNSLLQLLSNALSRYIFIAKIRNKMREGYFSKSFADELSTLRSNLLDQAYNE